MAVVSFCSAKGGAGKTTSSNLLATVIAHQGQKVTLVDADPRGRQVHWWNLAPIPDSLTVVADPTEEIVSTIEKAEAESDLVVIDLPGHADMVVSDAISRSHLVLIPVQPSPQDAREAVEAVQLIRRVERRFRIEVPHVAMLTRVNPAIITREQKVIEEEFAANGVPFLPCSLNERAAFKSIFGFGGTLYDLQESQVSGLEKARQNAERFARAVLSQLHQEA